MDNILTFIAYGRIDFFTFTFHKKSTNASYSTLANSHSPAHKSNVHGLWRLLPNDCLTLLAAPATPAEGDRDLTHPHSRVIIFLSYFSSWPHQPRAEGEIHPSWRRSSGPHYVPLSWSTVQTRLPQRLSNPLLFLCLPQRCLSAFGSLCSHYANDFSVIQGEMRPDSLFLLLLNRIYVIFGISFL